MLGPVEELVLPERMDDLLGALGEVANEAIRAHLKHGTESLLDPDCSHTEGRKTKLGLLMEEVGEVARCLTYDEEDSVRLREELIQVANVALSWAAVLPVPDDL